MPVLTCDAFQLRLISALLEECAEGSLPEGVSKQSVRIRACSAVTLLVFLIKWINLSCHGLDLEGMLK